MPFSPRVFVFVLFSFVFLLTLLYPSPEVRVSQETTTITLAFWGSYEEWKMWQEIVQGFNRIHPEIRVRLNYIPGNYDDKIRLLLAADSAPDVMLIQDEPFPAYVNYGKFEDLTDLIRDERSGIDWEHDFWPTAAESFVYKCRIYGIPIWGGTVLIYYNKQMFRDAGVDFPSDDWDMEKFVEKARELTRDTDNDGKYDFFGFAMPNWVYYLPWSWAFGARYLNESRTDWAFTDEHAVEAMRFCQDLLYRYRVSPSPYDMPNTDLNAMFMTGRVGMSVSGPWNSPPLRTAGIDFDVVHMPCGPTGERYTRVTWDCLAMFAGCKHKEAAWTFMAYCVSYEAQAVVGRYVRSVPALRAAQDAFMDGQNGWSEEKFIESLSYARYQPISLHWNQMDQLINQEYERLLLNRQSPEEMIQRLAAAMVRENVFPLTDEMRP